MGWLKCLTLGLAASCLNDVVIAQSDTDMKDPSLPPSDDDMLDASPPPPARKPMSWPDPPFVWDPVHQSCQGMGAKYGYESDEKAQEAILDEVILLADNALTKMKQLEGNIDKAKTDFHLHQTWHTYDEFFNIGLEDTQDRWDSVKSSMKAMQNLRALKYIYLMCDDEKTFERSDNGQVIYEAPNDPSVRYEPKQDISCATQKGKIGYRYSSGSDNMASAKYPQYIVICWKQQTSHDITVRQVNDKVVRGGSLDEYTTLTTVLFHEFMHATVPAMKADLAGGTAKDGERYELSGAWEVRNTYATMNPDSLTLFALALGLDDWIWIEGGKAMSEEEYWEKYTRKDNAKKK